MTKLIIAPALALTLSLLTAVPAQANPMAGDMTLNANPLSALIGLLLPAVQKVREAAAR